MTLDSSTSAPPAWHDTALPVPDRVEALVAEMRLEEKVAQLVGVWVGASAEGAEVAPHQHDMEDVVDLDALLPQGLGQLTRPFGTAPVDPALGALSLMRTQQRIVGANRFGIPAVAHEECLAGFAAWGATAYPVPLSWGATFDPELVRRMASAIGADLRSVGVHQGLAPVLDVVRDARWGRVEETAGEDPYLVGTITTAYVEGLQSAGVVATLKHLVGYSASRAGRNLAPVSMGTRERADVMLPPFEMAVRAGARSVMHAYTDTDGVPSAADESLLTGLLRDDWGFEGTVVADYFGIGFLHLLHGVAGTWGEAATAALTAGVDVELPTVKAYGEPLLEAVRSGAVDEVLVDRALRRVLTQKAELGLLDPDYDPTPPVLRGRGDAQPAGAVDLDGPVNRALAREVAERSVVLLRNAGVLPLRRRGAVPRRLAVVGPNADTVDALLGCYSFPLHVGVQHPDVPVGIELPTLLQALRAELPEVEVTTARGTGVDDGATDGIAEAVRVAEAADVVVVALGDRSGLFGRGTSGEGCDAADLALPGAQQQLLDALLAAGTPVVVVLLAGRPYCLGAAATEAAAVVAAFLPGEEGAGAVAGVLSGRVAPEGRLPVSLPARPGSQPTTYLAAPLDRRSEVSDVDPTPAFAFGHGLTLTEFTWGAPTVQTDEVDTAGTVRAAVTVTNTGDVAGTEVVQVYLHDPVASVVRPVQRLVAYARVPLEPGASATVDVALPADLTSFTGRDGRRVVEPGAIELRFGASSADVRGAVEVLLTGSLRVVDHRRALHPDVRVSHATAPQRDGGGGEGPG
ncbi:beta-xylosidase/alpha-l-arabinosidase [Angustibacter aerolatus]